MVILQRPLQMRAATTTAAPPGGHPLGSGAPSACPHGVVYFSAPHTAWPVKLPVTSRSGTVVTTSMTLLRTANWLSPAALLNFPVPPVTVKVPTHPSFGLPVQVQLA